jgi:hypothetical protein
VRIAGFNFHLRPVLTEANPIAGLQKMTADSYTINVGAKGTFKIDESQALFVAPDASVPARHFGVLENDRGVFPAANDNFIGFEIKDAGAAVKLHPFQGRCA